MSIHLYREQLQTTLVSNHFIDTLMPGANGEFVKVYLYLLRSASLPGISCTISGIADALSNTEADVMRALRYWEKVGGLTLDVSNGEIRGVHFPDKTENVRLPGTLSPFEPDNAGAASQADFAWGIDAFPSGSKAELADTAKAPGIDTSGHAASMDIAAARTDFEQDLRSIPSGLAASMDLASIRSKSPDELPGSDNRSPAIAESDGTTAPVDVESHQLDDDALEELFAIIQAYLGSRQMTYTDTNRVLSWLDTLHLSREMILYLVETCVEGGHASLNYMDKVAISWCENNITTVDQAKANSFSHTKLYYGVQKAFGISGRKLGEKENRLLNRWSKELQLTTPVILEACNRTMSSIQKPSFEYTDSILTGWHKKGVRSLEDIEKLDKDYQAERKSKREPASQKAVRKTRFSNFDQRNYDYDKLETMLLNTSV